MLIWFYAPLKSPNHPQPSGDRQIARLLIQALKQAGHQVELISELRSYDGVGDWATQNQILAKADRERQRLIEASAQKPDCWVTYHCYHKAPDLLGPVLSRHFQIPYLIFEPSFAGKQSGGRCDHFHKLSQAALISADLLLCLTQHDQAGLAKAGVEAKKIRYFPPFLDGRSWVSELDRNLVRQRLGLDDDTLVMICVAMKRAGDKARSYQMLAQALAELSEVNWCLLAIGDGKAAAEINDYFRPFGRRYRDLGRRQQTEIAEFMGASDLYVWPGYNEAFGMAPLEAQAMGLPVISTQSRGIPDVVQQGVTGILVEDFEPKLLADAIRELARNPERRHQMSQSAQNFIRSERSLEQTSLRLNQILAEVID